jgi:hypothetical protein
MSSMSSAADTAAWRELLPWATPEERRELLDSEHPAALEALAVVLAARHGDPMRPRDGELLPSRC